MPTFEEQIESEHQRALHAKQLIEEENPPPPAKRTKTKATEPDLEDDVVSDDSSYESDSSDSDDHRNNSKSKNHITHHHSTSHEHRKTLQDRGEEESFLTFVDPEVTVDPVFKPFIFSLRQSGLVIAVRKPCTIEVKHTMGTSDIHFEMVFSPVTLEELQDISTALGETFVLPSDIKSRYAAQRIKPRVFSFTVTIPHGYILSDMKSWHTDTLTGIVIPKKPDEVSFTLQ